ncbi:MAG TPA: Ig-like domain-containing protein, partial [Terriglobales bacterium]|nr:Ig-like domain-containing protein [Terriglobales bacterium]
DNSTFGIDDHVLNAGSASWATSLLPGGIINLRANYAGDGNYGASESAAPGVAVTVNPEASKMTLRIISFDLLGNITSQNATNLSYGSPYILRMDVTNSSGTSCGPLGGGCPTGNVTLTDNGSPLDGINGTGVFQLNNLGYAEDQPIQLNAGAHSLQATYPGDASFSAPLPANDSVTITQAVTTTTAAATGLPKGATLTVTVGSSSNGTPPSGTVSLSLNGQQVGGGPLPVTGVPATTNGQGQFVGAQAVANFSDTTLANGTYTLKASYTGDQNYKASSVQTTITVKPDFLLTASTGVINIMSVGGSGNLTLTIAANDGFTGAVQFACSGLPAESTCTFSPASVTNSGNTTLTVTTTGPHQVAKLEQRLGWPAWGISSSFAFGGMILVGVSGKRRLWSRLAALVVFGFLLAIVGCGGGGGGSNSSQPHTDPGTPTGSFPVTVTATSGTLSHSVGFTLNTP